jgi:hypothetical protein
VRRHGERSLSVATGIKAGANPMVLIITTPRTDQDGPT